MGKIVHGSLDDLKGEWKNSENNSSIQKRYERIKIRKKPRKILLILLLKCFFKGEIPPQFKFLLLFWKLEGYWECTLNRHKLLSIPKTEEELTLIPNWISLLQLKLRIVLHEWSSHPTYQETQFFSSLADRTDSVHPQTHFPFIFFKRRSASTVWNSSHSVNNKTASVCSPPYTHFLKKIRMRNSVVRFLPSQDQIAKQLFMPNGS